MSKSSSNCTAGIKGVKKKISCEIAYLKLCPMSMSKFHTPMMAIHTPFFGPPPLYSGATSRYSQSAPSFLDVNSRELCQKMECLSSAFGL